MTPDLSGEILTVRTEQLKTVAKLVTKEQLNLCIRGPRYIGKTYFMRGLEHELTVTHNLLPVYLACAPGQEFAGWRTVLQRLYEIWSNRGFGSLELGPDYHIENSTDAVVTKINAVLKELRNQCDGVRIVLLHDDFPNVDAAGADSELGIYRMSLLRLLTENRGTLGIIVASSSPLTSSVAQFMNPVDHWLLLLSDSEARALVCERLTREKSSFSPRVASALQRIGYVRYRSRGRYESDKLAENDPIVDVILSRAGGHPYYLDRYCDAVSEHNWRLGADRQWYTDTVRPHLTAIWHTLNKDQRRCLIRVARDANSVWAASDLGIYRTLQREGLVKVMDADSLRQAKAVIPGRKNAIRQYVMTQAARRSRVQSGFNLRLGILMTFILITIALVWTNHADHLLIALGGLFVALLLSFLIPATDQTHLGG